MIFGDLERDFFANTIRQYLIAAGVFAGVYAALLILRRVVLDRLRRHADQEGGRLHELYAGLIDQFRGPEAPPLVAFYVAIRQLNMPPILHRIVYIVVVLAVAYRLIRIAQIALAITTRQVVDSHDGGVNEGAIKNINYLTNSLVWVIGIIVALGNLGVHVEAIITGLGIGGIAIALAAQQVLSDLFSAIAIFLDRPFVAGDVIALDKDWTGTVERVGLKTTRVRAPSGELMVFPNSQLTSSKLRNYRHLQQRRVAFQFAVARDTDAEKARRVKGMVEDLIKKVPHIRFDRVHLADINETSLDFEVVYHVLDADYAKYMDANEAILLGVLDTLKKEGVKAVQPK